MSVLEITKENFEKEVSRSPMPVLLDFWAEWCGPCQMLAPVVEQIAQEMTEVKVGKVNVDQEADLAQRFRVRSIPTLVLLERGEERRRLVGAQPKKAILDLLGG